MLRDARDLSPDTRLVADICIVGAGPAGITLARDLRGRGLRVLLLESGGREPEDDADDLNEGDAIGMPEARLTRCRARVLGGATSKWAGWCRPLDPEDFEPRSWIPMSGWPISRRDLEPWYEAAQATCQIGALDYDAAAMATRLDRPALPFHPARAETVAYQYSPPTRFGAVYLEDLEKAPDVETLLHANLVEIVLADAGGAVRELRCATLSGGGFTVRAERIVLAAGGIENARLLLASNRQEPAGVGNGRGHVGRYFMEHPHFYSGALLLARDPAALRLYLGRHEVSTYPASSGDAGSQPLEVRPATVAAAVSLPAEVRAREGLQGLAATLREEDPDLAFEGGVGASDIAALMRADPGAALFRLDARAEQRPNPASRVAIGEDRDPLGLPRVSVTWDVAAEDFESARRTLALLGAEVGRLAAGRVWIPEDDQGAYAPPVVGAGCHHMGTTRMSADPTDGVVDADGRVHGVDNLFVVGSSVFRTGGFSNPTLTIVALAHRLADHLARLPSSSTISTRAPEDSEPMRARVGRLRRPAVAEVSTRP